MRWYAGSDHAGLELKNALVATLRELGDEVTDLGTHTADSVDYPDFGREVAERVVGDDGSLGLVVCGTGNGISIAANKVHGARAALVFESFGAEMARRHNNANIVALGARITGMGTARAALESFRNAEFEGGRHARRVDAMMAIEKG